MLVQCAGVELELFTELQPLKNKTADTIGHALILVAGQALDAMTSTGNFAGCARVRVVHLITGDGIGTNQAATRRVAQRFLHQPGLFQASDGSTRSIAVRYSVCEWTCSSHCANLCVHVAICGELTVRPTDNSDICAATTRLYKYLQVDYAEEFAASLK